MNYNQITPASEIRKGMQNEQDVINSYLTRINTLIKKSASRLEYSFSTIVLKRERLFIKEILNSLIEKGYNAYYSNADNMLRIHW